MLYHSCPPLRQWLHLSWFKKKEKNRSSPVFSVGQMHAVQHILFEWGISTGGFTEPLCFHCFHCVSTVFPSTPQCNPNDPVLIWASAGTATTVPMVAIVNLLQSLFVMTYKGWWEGLGQPAGAESTLMAAGAGKCRLRCGRESRREVERGVLEQGMTGRGASGGQTCKRGLCHILTPDL